MAENRNLKPLGPKEIADLEAKVEEVASNLASIRSGMLGKGGPRTLEVVTTKALSSLDYLIEWSDRYRRKHKASKAKLAKARKFADVVAKARLEGKRPPGRPKKGDSESGDE